MTHCMFTCIRHTFVPIAELVLETIRLRLSIRFAYIISPNVTSTVGKLTSGQRGCKIFLSQIKICLVLFHLSAKVGIFLTRVYVSKCISNIMRLLTRSYEYFQTYIILCVFTLILINVKQKLSQCLWMFKAYLLVHENIQETQYKYIVFI